MALHRRRYDAAYFVCRCDQVPVGDISVSRRGPMPPMTEQLADQGEVLAGHDSLTCSGMPQVMPCRRSLPSFASAQTVRQQVVSIQRPRSSACRGNRYASGSRGPGSASSSASRNWAMLFLGFFLMPRQGLVLRSRKPHSSARNIIERRISKARLAAPGRFSLAASNHAATSSGPMRSRGILPNAGRMQALR